MTRILPLVVLLWLGTDHYFFQAVQTFAGPNNMLWLYWLPDLLLITGLLLVMLTGPRNRFQQKVIPVLMGGMLLVFIPKLFSSVVLLAEDGTRLFRGFPARAYWVSGLTLGLAVLLFGIVLFGITRGRHFYRVRRETIYFPDLPQAFDGFTITQITDVHSGSFSSAEGVQKGLDIVRQQQSDVILFTGDLVNNRAEEMDPWIAAFAGLSAPMGKFSILGNHDYGDYIRWETQNAKRANLARLKQVHQEIGFRLLLDESITLEKSGQSITLIGVENWGKGSFHKYGDLNKATAAVSYDAFKILMSHDPSHWEGVILDHQQHIHLTLSGHTHGMQFGIELFGLKWSPIKYVYKQWAGLYKNKHKDNNKDRYLYVNRGFGFLGLRGRIGIWPEVAVITLQRQ